MQRMRNALGLLIIVSLVLAGCATSTPAAQKPAAPASGSTPKGLVAFSQGTLENEWRVLNTQDMERAFKEAGYDFVWTDAKADPAKQLADVEDLLAKKPSLLVIAPVEYEPLAPVKDMAEKADVPLIVIDRAIPGEPGVGKWIALLTIDFVETGTLVAEDAVQELTKKYGSAQGKLVHITGSTGASPVIDEQKGIDGVLAGSPNVKIVASCDGKYAREPGRKCMEDLLQKFAAGEIDGVIADNDEMVLGAIQAIKAAGRTELLGWIWGKDGTKTGLEALLAGDMTMTVQTPPYFGDLTVKVFEDWKAGKAVEKLQYTPKERFDNDTAEERARVEKRIKELDEMKVGCC